MWKLTVEVTKVTDDDGTHKFIATGTYTTEAGESSETAAKFVNKYTVPGTFTPKVRKVVMGTGAAGDRQTFSFNLTGEGIENQIVTIVDSDAEYNSAETEVGVASFETIIYTQEGTYTYHITETKGNDSNYMYDGAKWKVVVEVKRLADGKLEATPTYYKDGKEVSGATLVTFTNIYTEPIEFTPKVNKEFTCRIPSEEAGDSVETFKFTLENEETHAKIGDTEVIGKGVGNFDAIRYEAAGVYKYLIKEEAGNGQYYEYDPSVWELTVMVERDEMTGKLSYNADYTRIEGGSAEKSTEYATFVNSYNPVGNLSIKKTVVAEPDNIAAGKVFYVTVESVEMRI